jgi:hypothetical protein
VETRGFEGLHAVFFKGKPHKWSLPAARSRKSGFAPVGMTRGELPIRLEDFKVSNHSPLVIPTGGIMGCAHPR